MAAVTWPPQNFARLYNILNKSAAFTGTAQSVVAAPGAGYQTILDEITITADTDDALISLYAGTDEDGNRIIYNKFKAGGGVEREYRLQKGLYLPANTALAVTASAGSAYIVLWYHTEAVPNTGV